MIHNKFKVVDGVPTGGSTTSVGIHIEWHDSSKSNDQNGAYPSDVIEAVRSRLEFLNDENTGFNCAENDRVITLLKGAEDLINIRLDRREEQGKATCEPE